MIGVLYPYPTANKQQHRDADLQVCVPRILSVMITTPFTLASSHTNYSRSTHSRLPCSSTLQVPQTTVTAEHINAWTGVSQQTLQQHTSLQLLQ
jgi:hypothetical protein